MTPPAQLDSVVQGNPDRSHPSASAGGMVSEWGGVVNPAIGIDTFVSDPLLGDNRYQNYRDFIARSKDRPLEGSPARCIAGTGERTKDTCGITRHWAACSKDKGHGAYPLLEHCDDPECPVCWGSWASKQSRKISERLRGYIRVARPELIYDQSELKEGSWFTKEPDELCFQYYDPDLGRFWEVGHKENAQNVRHFVLSAPEGEIGPEISTAQIHAVGKFWAKWVGIRGGMMVFHPWRILPDVKRRLMALIPRRRESQEEHEKKHWQIIRENGLRLECWQSYVYWSPHFHIIGFGYICDSPNFNKLTGWFVKEVRNISQKQVWDGHRMKDDITAISYYLLSHCNIEWCKKSVMWIGCMTPVNLKRLKEKPEIIQYSRECRKCQAQEIVYNQTPENVPGEPSIGHDGQWQWLYYREKLYRYHIVAGEEKDAAKEERRRRRSAKATSPGPGLSEAGRRSDGDGEAGTDRAV